MEGQDRCGGLDQRFHAGADRCHAPAAGRRRDGSLATRVAGQRSDLLWRHTDVRKAVGAGEFALGLVNHYYYHLQLAEGSKVGVIYPDQGDGQLGLITNTTAVAVVKGAQNVS